MITVLISIIGAALVWGLIEWIAMEPKNHAMNGFQVRKVVVGHGDQNHVRDKEPILIHTSPVALWGNKISSEILTASPSLKEALDKVEIEQDRKS